MGEAPQNLIQKLFGIHPSPPQNPNNPPQAIAPTPTQPARPSPNPDGNAAPDVANQPQPEQPKKKGNFFRRLFGGGNKQDQNDPNGQQPKNPPAQNPNTPPE
jgi:penicillin-binding protein 1B